MHVRHALIASVSACKLWPQQTANVSFMDTLKGDLFLFKWYAAQFFWLIEDRKKKPKKINLKTRQLGMREMARENRTVARKKLLPTF